MRVEECDEKKNTSSQDGVSIEADDKKFESDDDNDAEEVPSKTSSVEEVKAEEKVIEAEEKVIEKKKENKDENEERGNWTGKLDFLLSLLGYAVGLGNVWRFPYLCYRNGGGAFLIPYTVFLILAGIPLFYLEMILGQFSSSGPLNCWDFAPIFQGIGFAQLVSTGLVNIYYNMIIAWSLFYLFSSLINATELPWITCWHEWNTEYCYDRLPDVQCNSSDLVRETNGTCTNGSVTVGLWSVSVYKNTTNLRRTTASDEYYNKRVLDLSSGIEVIGPVKWDLALSLLLAWVMVFICMIKGIKTTGKVVYFTAIFPYVVLIILLGRGLSLPGAIDGVFFFIKPDFSRLKDARVWSDAAIQLFFSMSNCTGGIVALSSYNRFHNNCLRDTVIVTLANWFTGVLAGFVIFSFLGFMARTMGVSVDDVVDSGPGLAFVVYPDAVTRLPIAPLWSILFFLMLLILGLDTEFAGVETILTSIMDQLPSLRRFKPLVVLGMCCFFYLLGLPLCTPGGSYLLLLMDTYSTGWAILLVGIIICIALSWVYGARRVYKDAELMMMRKQSLWWRICWQFLTPACVLFVLIFSWVDYQPAVYGSYKYPTWADVLGWLMTISIIIWVPLVAIWKLARDAEGTLKQRLKTLSSPTISWGPALPKHRVLVTYVEGFVVNPRNLDWVPQEVHENMAFEEDIESGKNNNININNININNINNIHNSNIHNSNNKTDKLANIQHPVDFDTLSESAV